MLNLAVNVLAVIRPLALYKMVSESVPCTAVYCSARTHLTHPTQRPLHALRASLGGTGPIAAKYGLGCDNLLAAEARGAG